MSLFSKIDEWLEERTGHRRLIGEITDEPIPGKARWSYVFGSALLILLGFQAFSGFLLALAYSPGSDSAHASVLYIMEQTVLGSFIRGLHHHGASFIVVLLFLHGLQVFLFGAYKRPRELNWVFGLVLAAILFAFAFTGYLLPWDQRAFWATKVGTAIMGSAPVAGPIVQTIVQGGTEVGNLTLTRFYAAHIFLLPILTLLAVAIHLALFRKHGITPPASVPPDAPSERFWPAQMYRDTVAGVVVVAALFLVAGLVPAKLGVPADPSVDYPARPEWFFLFLFQILKYFEGPFEIFGTVVVPPLLALLVLAIPFLDRGPGRGIRERKAILALGLMLAVGWVMLTGLAVYDDYQSGHFEEVAVWETEPDRDFDTEAFYDQKCKKCHGTGWLRLSR